MTCWRGLCFGNNDKKILIEFFKNSSDKIINQMEMFYSRIYNTEFKLINTEILNKEYIYTLINSENTEKLIIEAELIKNSFTYRLLIYKVNKIYQNDKSNDEIQIENIK